jgi:hypothetical protein
MRMLVADRAAGSPAARRRDGTDASRARCCPRFCNAKWVVRRGALVRRARVVPCRGRGGCWRRWFNQLVGKPVLPYLTVRPSKSELHSSMFRWSRVSMPAPRGYEPTAPDCPGCGHHELREKRQMDEANVDTDRRTDPCSACASKASPGKRQRLAEEAPSPKHDEPTFAPPPVAVRDDLGISLETFRELQLLQTREITEEDYDLLLLLHAKPSTKVFEKGELREVSEAFSTTSKLDDACAVCLGPMCAGEELCRLSCEGRHTYHRSCIHEWLTTASRCCPIDKQELSARQSSTA